MTLLGCYEITQGILDFETEDDLYGFLEASYDYFFGNASEPPEPPEEDG